MGAGEPSIARLPEATPADTLRVGALAPGPWRILLREDVGGLPLAGGLQRLVLLPGLEAQKAGLLLGPRTLRPVGARRAIFARKAHLPHHAVLGIGVREPGDTLLAHRARHHLLIPVDQKVGFVEPRARPGLPTRVIGDRTDQGDAVRPLAVHQ